MSRRPLDLSVYLITDSGLCGSFGVRETVAAAVGAGATAVQLRDQASPDADLVSLGRAVVRVLAGSGVPLIVNDRVDLVAAIGADGAHVGQGDLDVGSARRELGPEAYLGLSVQTLEQVSAARRTGVELDYLGVGPVWPQITKPDAGEPSGLDRLREIVAASPWPCVAIGGIGPGRVRPVRAAGVAGVAVVSAICGSPDPAAATRALRVEWDGAADVA